MCRKNELFGSCIMALGAGMLMSLLFGSDLAMALLGIGLVLGGLCFCKRR